MFDRLTALEDELDVVEARLSDPDVLGDQALLRELSTRHKELVPLVVAGQEPPAMARKVRAKRPRPRQATVGQSVVRKVDPSGNVSFAGTNYRVGRAHIRRQVQVAMVGDTVEISVGSTLIRTHRAHHDRTREHGALANPGGRPHRTNAA